MADTVDMEEGKLPNTISERKDKTKAKIEEAVKNDPRESWRKTVQ